MYIVHVHGWMSGPRSHWFPWVVAQLEKRGHTVVTPAMPHPELPVRSAWVATLQECLTHDPGHTILIGHSLGTPTILYALAEHEGPPFAHVVCVSGLARVIPELPLVTRGFDMGFDFDAIRPKASVWTVIHGDNDYIVPFAEGEWLAKQLKVKPLLESGKGHLTWLLGVLELQSVVDAVDGKKEKPDAPRRSRTTRRAGAD